MTKKVVVSWDYIPVLTMRVVDENWDGDREPRDIREDELELLRALEALVNVQQETLAERFGYSVGFKPFRLIYHG